MNKSVLQIGVLLSVLFAQWAMAVNESRIWLPKKYSAAKPKLLLAAKEAEQTTRCMEVVAGEIIVRKSSAEHYYFVITCRDKNFRTYNLSYRYPVAGHASELLVEQQPINTPKKEKVEVAETGVSREQVVALCSNALRTATDSQDEVTLLVDQAVAPAAHDDGFSYNTHFTALSELGNAVLYRANCQVNNAGKVALRISLEREGALVICLDSLRAESMLLGRAKVVNDEIITIPIADDRFHFQIPFDVKTRGSSAIRYSADCQVDAEGDNEIEMTLEPMGALAICRDNLRQEVFLMKSVEIAALPLSQARQGEQFSFQLAFSAKGASGGRRSFKADCLVDEEGEAEVTTEIDQGAITAVCIAGLKLKTSAMLGVTILEKRIPALVEDIDGFVSIIPFDAKNPSGRLLRYQAECRVDGSGKSKIKLKARKN